MQPNGSNPTQLSLDSAYNYSRVVPFPDGSHLLVEVFQKAETADKWDYSTKLIGTYLADKNGQNLTELISNGRVSIQPFNSKFSFSTPTPSPTEKPLPPYYVVFSTGNSTLYNGNLGGISGADSICMQEAQAAGLSGEFKAWLSDVSTDAKDHIAPETSLPYRTTDPAKTLVANNIADLTDGSINNPIQYSASGEKISDVSKNDEVWTGTLANGTKVRSNPNDAIHFCCDNWTLNDPNSPGGGASGHNLSIVGEWTYTSGWNCSQMKRLYCFQTE
jgi:hypothetical protein